MQKVLSSIHVQNLKFDQCPVIVIYANELHVDHVAV